MTDTAIIYDEQISPATAAKLLGLEPFVGDVTCKLITTLTDTTIMIHDNITGEEKEYRLEENNEAEGLDMPMEKDEDYKHTIPANMRVLNIIVSSVAYTALFFSLLSIVYLILVSYVRG